MFIQHLCTRINVVYNIQPRLYKFQEAPNRMELERGDQADRNETLA